MNRNGLTFELWAWAARADAGARRAEDLRAWEAGEDPSEHRAARELAAKLRKEPR